MSAAAAAGPVTEVNFLGQPLQYTKQGAVDGCGVRLVGITAPVPGVKKVHTLDVSFNVANPGGGIVKGGLMTLSVQALAARKLDQAVEVPIKGLWLKAPGSPATTPAEGKVLRAVTHKHALMYGARLPPVLALIEAMQEGKPIQVGFRVSADDMDHVFFGKVEMTDAETAQFTQCYSEWIGALNERLKDRVKQ